MAKRTTSWSKFIDLGQLTPEVKSYNVANIDISPLLPALLESYIYQYKGSLTTEPYTEGVAWNVIQSVQSLSQGQLDKFKKAELSGSAASE